jgi:hypothetical protein
MVLISINLPQAAVLGMHTIKEKPVVVKGEIVIRPIMVVALTYDHRLLDGREAVTFLGESRSSLCIRPRSLLKLDSPSQGIYRGPKEDVTSFTCMILTDEHSNNEDTNAACAVLQGSCVSASC